jgi:hypothetical protein
MPLSVSLNIRLYNSRKSLFFCVQENDCKRYISSDDESIRCRSAPRPSRSSQSTLSSFRRRHTPHLHNCNRNSVFHSGGCVATTAVPATLPPPPPASALFALPPQLCSAPCARVCGLSSSSRCPTTAPPPVSSEPGPSTPLVRQCAHRLYEIVTFHAAHAACVPLRDDAYVLHP